jgi:hypothetical protein
MPRFYRISTIKGRVHKQPNAPHQARRANTPAENTPHWPPAVACMRWLGDGVSIDTWGACVSEPPFKKDTDVIATCTKLLLMCPEHARDRVSLFSGILLRGGMRRPQNERHSRYARTTPSCKVTRLGEPEGERKDDRRREEREFADEVSATASLEYCVWLDALTEVTLRVIRHVGIRWPEEPKKVRNRAVVRPGATVEIPVQIVRGRLVGRLHWAWRARSPVETQTKPCDLAETEVAVLTVA